MPISSASPSSASPRITGIGEAMRAASDAHHAESGLRATEEAGSHALQTPVMRDASPICNASRITPRQAHQENAHQSASPASALELARRVLERTNEPRGPASTTADALAEVGSFGVRSFLGVEIVVRLNPDLPVPEGAIVFELEEIARLITLPREQARELLRTLHAAKRALGTDSVLESVGPAPNEETPTAAPTGWRRS